MTRVAPLVVASLVAMSAGCADPCCEDSGDCAVGALCFEGVCAQACVDDGGCAVGEVCVKPAGACAQPLRAGPVCPFEGGGLDPGCATPDPFEPNDRIAQAGSAPELAQLALCPAGDEDFFRVDLRAGETLEIEIRFDGEAGDLDLQLLNEEGEVLGESTLLEDRERITALATQDVRVFIRVFGFNDAQNDYEIETAVVPAAECPRDEFEPNDEEPHQIPVPAEISGTLCPGDEDLFTFDTPGNVSGRLLLEHDHPDGVFVEIFRPGGGGVVADTGPGFAVIDPFNIGAPGALILRVVAFDERQVNYTFSLELDGAEECVEDEREPDNTDEDATLIVLPALAEGALCDGDEDRLRFVAEEDVLYDLVIEHDDPQGLDVVVRRPGGGSAAADNRPGRVELLNFRSLVAGELLIDVEPRTSGNVRYTLTLAEAGGAPGGCGDDDHEPNDDIGAATVVDELGATLDGAVCGPDVDFFRYTALDLPTSFLSVSGDGVRFVAFTQDGFFEDVTVEGDGSEQIFPPPTDDLVVVVSAPGLAARPYSIFTGFGE